MTNRQREETDWKMIVSFRQPCVTLSAAPA